MWAKHLRSSYRTPLSMNIDFTCISKKSHLMQERVKLQPDFLADGGIMGERIRQHDWSATPVGPIETWPHSLRTAVGIMLHSKFPTYIAVGQD